MNQKNKQKNKDILENTQNSPSTETKVFNLESLSEIYSADDEYENLSLEELKSLYDNELLRKEKAKIKKAIKNKK